MKNENLHYEHLGRFVVMFQHIEGALTDLLALMTNAADDEIAHILVNELEYNKRVTTTDVVFARLVDVRRDPAEEPLKAQFHDLMSDLKKLGDRRNELVHSTYSLHSDKAGVGLLRQNTKLRCKVGIRQVDEEIFVAENLDQDFKRLDKALTSLEEFRLKIIDWRHPLAVS